MKNKWKSIKSVALLIVLPLVATAAASAHQWMTDSNPISLDLDQIEISADQSINASRMHTIALNRAGAVQGRIASIDSDTREALGIADLKIFFIQNGEIVQETTTNEAGEFRSSVSPKARILSLLLARMVLPLTEFKLWVTIRQILLT
jgi:hypothetical protein